MSTARTKKLVIGNWKMHGALSENTALLTALRAYAGSAEVAVCVPFPYLAQTRQLLEGSALTWGAQDISAHTEGAYTGEVSARMLADFSCRWVLAGHSERRTYHGESDAQVAAKVVATLSAGITPVVCMGETLSQHQEGQLASVLQAQLQPLLALGAARLGALVLAYEPIWAIGTGHSASPRQAQQAHALIRAQLAAVAAPLAQSVRILYGGSVTADNVAGFYAMPDIDGVLVGGASLRAQEFLRIAAAQATG